VLNVASLWKAWKCWTFNLKAIGIRNIVYTLSATYEPRIMYPVYKTKLNNIFWLVLIQSLISFEAATITL